MSDFFTSDLSIEDNDMERVEIFLMSGFFQDLKIEFDLNRWTDKEGFYYVLAAGLAALQNVRQHRILSQDESAIINQLQSERVQLLGRYAAMKHQVSELSQEVTHLEAKLKATQTQLFALLKHTPVLATSLIHRIWNEFRAVIAVLPANFRVRETEGDRIRKNSPQNMTKKWIFWAFSQTQSGHQLCAGGL
jgi:hypothetical protein